MRGFLQRAAFRFPCQTVFPSWWRSRFCLYWGLSVACVLVCVCLCVSVYVLGRLSCSVAWGHGVLELGLIKPSRDVLCCPKVTSASCNEAFLVNVHWPWGWHELDSFWDQNFRRFLLFPSLWPSLHFVWAGVFDTDICCVFEPVFPQHTPLMIPQGSTAAMPMRLSVGGFLSVDVCSLITSKTLNSVLWRWAEFSWG